MKEYSLGTKCVQGGYTPGNGEPRQIPIVQSTTFKYETSEAMGRLFDLEEEGYFYSRLQNPTNDTVARKICELEGGSAAMLTSSGQAASFYAVFNIASCGDHIVSSSSIYGGTYNLFAVTMKRMGIDFTFVSPDCTEEELNAAFQPHGAGLGGCIVDSGNFDWAKYPDKYPGLCTPDDSYHGVIYTERFGIGGAYITKATAQLMRDFGSMQSPQNAFILNLGLESLEVRMKRHCDNGLAVAQFLQQHEKVTYVNYCGLEGDKYHALAEKYLPNGSCGVVSFGVKGGRKAAENFMKHLKIAAIETHVADARTCCLHPASATHRQMNDEELEACGVKPDLIRYSCGLENAEDLIADLAQALDQI